MAMGIISRRGIKPVGTWDTREIIQRRIPNYSLEILATGGPRGELGHEE